MNIGDLIWDDTGELGIIVSVGWCTAIGTPFDYGYYCFRRQLVEGIDTQYLSAFVHKK